MPEGLRSIAEFITQNRGLLIAAGLAFALVVIAIVTVIVGLRRGRRGEDEQLTAAKKVAAATEPAAVTGAHEPRVKRTKLTVGDVASPWTQVVFERHEPEEKIAVLLPAFAFDIDGSIHRTQTPELAREFDAIALMQQCDSATGVATFGALATLALWHCGRTEYALVALKVASHMQMASEQRDVIRFLFQDAIGIPVKVSEVPSLGKWRNTRFAAAHHLYTTEHVTGKDWPKLEGQLAPSLRKYYDNELARKLPIRGVYRQAPQSAVFSEGLYYVNLACLARHMNPKRWLRLLSSDKSRRFRDWVENLPCQTENDALLQIANPEIYDAEDLTPQLRESIPRILNATRSRDWLFNQGKMPPLTRRVHYFKFFCLFGRYNEAVRCFATLSIMKRDRAIRLFYARALFSSGMQHDAWSEISALLADFPRDAVVLNETAIYAHKMGRFDEAAELFGMARSLYPDDATLAYNEAVFTEQFSKKQIEDKWTRVQQLTQPPVAE